MEPQITYIQLLVRFGLAADKEQARAMIGEGRVFSNSQQVGEKDTESSRLADEFEYYIDDEPYEETIHFRLKPYQVDYRIGSWWMDANYNQFTFINSNRFPIILRPL